MSEKPFPHWGQPASKGDIIYAMVNLKLMISAAQNGIRAIRSGDKDGMDKAETAYNEMFERVDKVIADLGGTTLEKIYND